MQPYFCTGEAGECLYKYNPPALFQATIHQNAERGCSTLITTSANRNTAVTEGTHPPVPFQWCWKQGQLLGWEHHLHFAPTSFPQVPAECNRNHHRVLCQAGHQCSSSSNIQIFDSFEKLEVW